VKTPAAIGVIGIGNMGLGLALRLIDTRHRIVVRDLRPEAETVGAGAGARVAPNPAALAREIDLLIVVVVDAPQSGAVLFGEQGLRTLCTRAAP
jgi:L-threonate 2-dehydrogenase